MRRRINQLARDKTAATAIEYGLIAALVAIAAVSAMGNLGNKSRAMWSYVEDNTIQD